MLAVNNNEFSTEPKMIDAFLYSNQTLEMYGIGFNIKIKGGVYGSNVILNATKGDTRDTLRVCVWMGWLCESGNTYLTRQLKSYLKFVFLQKSK